MLQLYLQNLNYYLNEILFIYDKYNNGKIGSGVV